jgi:hypothetical protein
VNAIVAVLERIQQAVLELPCDQFPDSVVLKGRGAEMLDRGNPCLGKHDDLDIHGALLQAAVSRGRLAPEYTSYGAG